MPSSIRGGVDPWQAQPALRQSASSQANVGRWIRENVLEIGDPHARAHSP